MQKDKNQKISRGEIVIYKKAGKPMLQVKVEKETVWLTQEQISLLFGIERSVITKHLRNIFKSSELKENSVCAKIAHTAADGKVYQTQFYNLDVIISVGYRVNSKRATEFRIWATKVLREYLIKGYTINQKRLSETGLSEFEQAVKLLKSTIESKKLSSDEAKGLLEIITKYSEAWLLLQKYDENKIIAPTKKAKAEKELSYQEATAAIKELKLSLLGKRQASDLFGQERQTMLQGIVQSIEQKFGSKELYPTIEDKAAHLLYFIIKDHPFVDGNKRIASLLFLVFLKKNNYDVNKQGEYKFNSNALVALALLIAESKPEQKEVMVRLIMNFLSN